MPRTRAPLAEQGTRVFLGEAEFNSYDEGDKIDAVPDSTRFSGSTGDRLGPGPEFLKFFAITTTEQQQRVADFPEQQRLADLAEQHAARPDADPTLDYPTLDFGQRQR